MGSSYFKMRTLFSITPPSISLDIGQVLVNAGVANGTLKNVDAPVVPLLLNRVHLRKYIAFVAVNVPVLMTGAVVLSSIISK